MKRRDVRFWPQADILIGWANVRFRVNSGHWRVSLLSRNSAALDVRLRASPIWSSSCAFIANDSNSLACLRSLLVGMRYRKRSSLLIVVPVPDIKAENALPMITAIQCDRSDIDQAEPFH